MLKNVHDLINTAIRYASHLPSKALFSVIGLEKAYFHCLKINIGRIMFFFGDSVNQRKSTQNFCILYSLNYHRLSIK
jgi:hypothetical protein